MIAPECGEKAGFRFALAGIFDSSRKVPRRGRLTHIFQRDCLGGRPNVEGKAGTQNCSSFSNDQQTKSNLAVRLRNRWGLDHVRPIAPLLRGDAAVRAMFAPLITDLGVRFLDSVKGAGPHFGFLAENVIATHH